MKDLTKIEKLSMWKNTRDPIKSLLLFMSMEKSGRVSSMLLQSTLGVEFLFNDRGKMGYK